MQKCEFCGSLYLEYASFCGQCGRVPTKAIETKTMASDFYMPDIQNFDTSSNVSVPAKVQPTMAYNQQAFISNIPTTSLNYEEEEEEEEEEERRRRAALLGIGIPLLGSLAVEGMPDAGNVPMVEGTPQMSGVPTGSRNTISTSRVYGTGIVFKSNSYGATNPILHTDIPFTCHYNYDFSSSSSSASPSTPASSILSFTQTTWM